MHPLIRLATTHDAAFVRAIYAPYVETSATSFEAVPPSIDEMAVRLRETLLTHPWLVAEGSQGIEGYAYAAPYRVRAAYRWSCEVTVYIAESAQRAGLGRRLYSALFALLLNQGYRRAYAGITLPNLASVRLHESVGFEPVGVHRAVGFKLGAWHDVGWWQRSIGDDEGPPAPTRDLASVCAGQDWSVF